MPMPGEPVGAEVPGTVVLGVVEGLVNLCPTLVTVPGVLVLGVVTTLGELVRTPVEGLVNL